MRIKRRYKAKQQAANQSQPAAPSAPAVAAPSRTAPPGGFRHAGKTYRTGEQLPARYSRVTMNGEPSHDPADNIDNAPPNFGRATIPQILTFNGRQSTVARVYRNPDEAVRHSIENARIMRSDCSVMECLETRQRCTALLNWHLEPEDKDDPKQKGLCNDLTAILSRTPRFTEYRRSLLDALWYGRAANQHVFGFETINGKKRTIVKNWLPIHGDKLAFRYDDGSGQYRGDEVGIKVGMGNNMRDIIAGDRKIEVTDYGSAYFLEDWERSLLAIHKHIIEDGAYEDVLSAGRIHGVGIRDRIYWCWFQKQETMAQLMEVIERTGTGFTIYYYPYGNAEAKQKMQEVAEEQSRNNVILMPRMGDDASMDAFGIDRIEPSTAGISALKEINDEFFGHQIKRYILGQTMSSVSQAAGMGSGLADLQMDTLYQIVDYDAVNLEETLTRELVEPLKGFNFPWARDVFIRFKIDTKSSESEEKLQAAKTAFDMGAKLKAQDVMDLIGFAMPTEDDEVLQNPQFMQQQRLWDQAHGGAGAGGSPVGADGQPAAAPGSNEDLFGPLMKLLGGGPGGAESGGDGEDGPPGGGDDGPPDRPSGPTRYKRIGSNESIQGVSGVGSSGPAPAHQVGETKNIGGIDYRLNENHRWGLANDTQAAPGEQPPVIGESNEDDHAARHAFVSKQLGKIDKRVGGIVRALHESPDYKQGCEIATNDFAPEQAGEMHGWLSQNAGKQAGGGQVVDLGEGRMGFASEAGSVVVWPADENGKHRVSYTTRTGVVTRAAGLDGGGQGGEQAGQPVDGQPPTDAPPQPDHPQPPGGQVPAEQPAAGPPAAQQPPPAPPAPPAAEPTPPPVQQSAPVPPPISTQPPPPQQPLTPGPTKQPHIAMRAKADEAHAKLQEAVASWERSQAVNASPKVHAQHKTNVAALRHIWSHHDKEATAAAKTHAKHRTAVAKAEKEALERLKVPTTGGKSTREHLDEQAEKLGGKPAPVKETPLIDHAEQNPGQGKPPQPTPEAMERAKQPSKQRKLSDLAAEYSDKFQVSQSDANKSLIQRAIKSGRIKSPKDLRGVLKTARKIHERGDVNADDSPALKEAIRRKANREGRDSWQSIAKQKAAEWDMTPMDFKTLADDVWKERKGHHEEREMAKQAARIATGLSQNDIHRLENDGYDSGSDHARTKGLDDVGRQLASQFPALGWGRGADSEQNSDDFDYGEHLWGLIREGKKPLPSRASPEFVKHVEDYLSSQLVSSVGGSSSKDTGEDWSSVPFAKRMAAAAQKWLYARQQPTDAQREAGNYQKRHIRLHGLEISIENDRGTRRRPEWPELSADYGYIRRTEGRDGDHVDVFVGPEPESELVYVVDQVNGDGKFDEHKCMLGWTNRDAAVADYLANYSPGWKLGDATAMTVEQFKNWLAEGDTKKPTAEQVSRYGKTYREEDHPRGQPENAGQYAAKNHKSRQETIRKRGHKMPRKKLLRMADAMFSEAAGDVESVNPKVGRQLANAAKRITTRLSREALRRLALHTSGVRFYENRERLQDEIERRDGRRDDTIAFFDADGFLHLNGARDTGEPSDIDLADLYAHEFSHAIDFKELDSSSDKWRTAWESELRAESSGVSDAGRNDPAEGWSEFGELAIMKPVEAANCFPLCFSYWQNSGLIK